MCTVYIRMFVVGLRLGLAGGEEENDEYLYIYSS